MAATLMGLAFCARAGPAAASAAKPAPSPSALRRSIMRRSIMDSVFVVIGCSPACFCRNTARAIRLRSIAKSRFSLPFRSSLARGFLAGNPVAASTPCRATALQSSRQPIQREARHVAQQLDEAVGLVLDRQAAFLRRAERGIARGAGRVEVGCDPAERVDA